MGDDRFESARMGSSSERDAVSGSLPAIGGHHTLVLLQNHISILPLKNGAKLVVLGPRSVAHEALMGNYYGQICLGEYRALGCVQTPLEAMQVTNGANVAAVESTVAVPTPRPPHASMRRSKSPGKPRP